MSLATLKTLYSAPPASVLFPLPLAAELMGLKPESEMEPASEADSSSRSGRGGSRVVASQQ